MKGIDVVRGGAAPEELAAVLAVIAARAEQREPALDGYAAWRAGRLAASRRTASPDRAARGVGSERRRA